MNTKNNKQLAINKKRFAKIFLFGLTLGFLASAIVLFDASEASAAVLDGAKGGADNIIKGNEGLVAIKKIITNVRTIVLGTAAALAVLFIVIGGVLFITSAGNEERVKQGKQFMTYAIGGLILIILAEVIIRVFATILGGKYG